MSKDKYGHISDADLLKRFYEDHNNEWLGILMERYTMLLLGVSMKYLKNAEEAKDAVQQVFLKVINDIHKYKVDSFKSWIYMVVRNHCLMELRKKDRFHSGVDEQTLTAPADAEIKRELVEKEMSLDNLSAAMLQLNKEQQLCVSLFYLEKRTYQQIADTCNFSIPQVKSHLQNGKRNLKRILDRMNDEEED